MGQRKSTRVARVSCHGYFFNLTHEQVAEAKHLFPTLRESSEQKPWRIAQLLLAFKGDHQLLGETEYQVRDLVHRVDTAAIQTALEGRCKRRIKDRA